MIFFIDIFVLGPDLPKPLTYHQMVSVDGTVIAISGNTMQCRRGICRVGDHSNSLYKLVCNQNCRWKELPQKVTVARRDFVAMTIPDEMTNCRGKVRTRPISVLNPFFKDKFIGANLYKQTKAANKTNTKTKSGFVGFGGLISNHIVSSNSFCC